MGGDTIHPMTASLKQSREEITQLDSTRLPDNAVLRPSDAQLIPEENPEHPEGWMHCLHSKDLGGRSHPSLSARR